MSLRNKHYFRLYLIIIATLFYFLANIQRVAVPGAIFDFLQNDFCATASKITFFGAIFCYIYAITQLIVGLLVDKFGGFKVIAGGTVIFVIGAMIFPVSNNIYVSYLARALLGCSSATFYLSAIREVKKYCKDSNFSIAISYILFVGYCGGIFANAPLVACINHFGWRNIFYFIAIFALVLCLIYLILLKIFNPINSFKPAKISITPFKEVLSNKDNIYLYIFGSTNYATYYVLQSVIGKKFLEDFCCMNTNTAATILSVMALVSAFAGTITAFISKVIGNKRAVIFKLFSILSMLSMLSICTLLILDIRSKFIALIFCIPAYIGSISPILILTLHLINRYKISASAIAFQNFSFFMMVGILGTLTGFLMNIYTPIQKGDVLIYQNNSYILVFGLFFLLSLIEIFFAFKTKDVYVKKTY